MRRYLLVVAGLFAFATGADAQTVTGKWDVEYPMRVRQVNGEPSAVEQMGKAVLTIETQKGDSIFGTWLTVPPADAPAAMPKPEPRRVVGAVSNGKLTMVGAPIQAMIRRNGGGGDDESTITMRTYFEATIKEAAIEGTMYSQTEDESIKSSPMKWTAKKAD
jgi:hypothetical protein